MVMNEIVSKKNTFARNFCEKEMYPWALKVVAAHVSPLNFNWVDQGCAERGSRETPLNHLVSGEKGKQEKNVTFPKLQSSKMASQLPTSPWSIIRAILLMSHGDAVDDATTLNRTNC